MSASAATEPARPDARDALSRGLADLPLLIVAVLLASTAADILPGDTIVGVGEVQLNLARILIVVGFAALAATAGPRALLVRTGIAIPLALLLVVALYTSHKWGTYPRYRFLVEGVAAFYLAAATVRARGDARDAIAAIGMIALAIAALSAVAQVAQGVQTGFYRHGCTPVTKPFGAAPADSVTRAVGTFANPNVLAGYLLLLVPLGALAGAFVRRVRGLWVAVALGVGGGYLALVLTFSRAAVFAALIALGVGILVARVRNRRWLLLVALGLGVAVLFLVGSCGSDAGAGYGRSKEWSDTLDVIKDNPVWGVGLGRLGDVLHGRDPASTAQHAHNLWLTWWADAGTGALLAWIWIAIALLWRSARSALGGDPSARAGLVALLAFFGFSLLDHPANVDRVALAFWIVAGLAAVSGPGVVERRRLWRRRAPPPPGTPGTGSDRSAEPAPPG
jgi:O-antigen ligase